ncbi:MAG TPA: hypothetical protein VG605_09640 [Puia sp.]|nr:hypothetical protein [Puia sp.]
MYIEQYTLVKNPSGNFYSFESIGPKGRIKKMVQYHRIQGYPPHVFNLSFGDWDEAENRIDDEIVTDNHDRDKILATVAATVILFTSDFPYAVIYIEGSTPARTRLYQMGIAKYCNFKPLNTRQWQLPTNPIKTTKSLLLKSFLT